MKKSLIALAVASALTVPMIAQADATLYGSLRAAVTSTDEVDAGENNTATLGDNASRIGIKGSQATGIDGVTATYRGEWKVGVGSTGDFGAGRLAYVGLNTAAGNLNIGRQWAPTYSVAGMTDILDSANSAPTHSYAALNGGRQNLVAYTSPNMGGFQFSAGAAMAEMGEDAVDQADGVYQDDNDNTVIFAADQAAADTAAVGTATEITAPVAGSAAVVDDNNIDGYNFAATYSIAGVTLAAGRSTNEAKDANITTIGASYSMDAFYVAVVNVNTDVALRGDDLGKSATEFAASYKATSDVLVLAHYVDFGDTDGTDMGSLMGVEAQYQLGAKARIAATYSAFNAAAEDAGRRDALQLSYRVDF
ncbi:MAG: putative porin [Motiliproteus sp.]|jgi:predicted porin